jgi:DNA repair ATPase RecN
MSDTPSSSEWDRYNRGALDIITHKVGKIDVLVEATRKLEERHTRLEASIAKMADAVTKLTVIEERQAQDRKEMADLRSALAEIVRKHDASADRIMTAVERLDDRVNALEKAEPMNAQTRRWVVGALGMLATIFVYAVANLLGLKG